MSVGPTNGIGPTQGQRKTLTRVGIEPTTFRLDYRCSTDGATRSDGSKLWEFKGARSRYFRSFCLILLIMSSKRQIGKARVFDLQNHGHITTENDFLAL